MVAGGSRLDRLFNLLSTGASGDIRTSAVGQIADLASAHPVQLPHLLDRAHGYLYHKDWETRTAAGQLLGLLAEHCAFPSVSELTQSNVSVPALANNSENITDNAGASCKSLAQFNLPDVLHHHLPLLASSGEEYQRLASKAAAGTIAEQRQQLNERLGIKGEWSQIYETGDLVSDADLVDNGPDAAPAAGTSARTANLLKRKSRAALQSANSKRSNLGSGSQEHQETSDSNSWLLITQGRWPFQSLLDALIPNLLHASWEMRHGAAIGLREILSYQASCVGVSFPLTDLPSGWLVSNGHGKPDMASLDAAQAQAAMASHDGCLSHCVAHVVQLLALDRFADYGSDQAVAPVRETAAQALGAAAIALSGDGLLLLATLLRQLCETTEWTVRQSGLLGLKYLLASNPSMKVLDAVMPVLIQSLQDSDDDVRAVAAEALLPVAAQLCKCNDAVQEEIIKLLWDALLEVDDLSPSIGKVMQLLAALHTAGVSKDAALHLPEVLPRSWPLFRHSLSSVRSACVNCLAALVSASASTNGPDGQHNMSPAIVPSQWLHSGLLATVICLLFQNVLVEETPSIWQASQDTLQRITQQCAAADLQQAFPEALAHSFIRLAAVPGGLPWPADSLDQISKHVSMRLAIAGAPSDYPKDGRGELVADARVAASACLASIAAALPAGTNSVAVAVSIGLQSEIGTERTIAALALAKWARIRQNIDQLPIIAQLAEECKGQLASGSGRPPQGFLEIEYLCRDVRPRLAMVLKHLADAGLNAEGIANSDSVRQVPPQALLQLVQMLSSSGSHSAAMHEAIQTLHNQIVALLEAQERLNMQVSACMSAAVIHVGNLPAKLNTVIQPLMGAIRTGAVPAFRSVFCLALASLVNTCKPAVAERIAKNTAAIASARDESPQNKASDLSAAASTPGAQQGHGAEAALQAITSNLGMHFISKLPAFWAMLTDPFSAGSTSQIAPSQLPATAIIDSLNLLRIVGPCLHPDLLPHLLVLLDPCWQACCSKDDSQQRAAVRCMASQVAAWTVQVMPLILRLILPSLKGEASPEAVAGAVQLVRALVQSLGGAVIPYSPLLILPIMQCMSNPQPSVRQIATKIFAEFIKLLPLAQGMQCPDNLDATQKHCWQEDSKFLLQLLDNSQAGSVETPFAIRAELREYQVAGISWLAFLRRCGLHGVLADDMGLGKTLQTSIILAVDHVEQRAQQGPRLKSLVICPPTLADHWGYEIAKYLSPETLSARVIYGLPQQRAALLQQASGHDVIIMSYESVRADIETLKLQHWNYLILDEGHIIRSPKSKITQACKQLAARHRLILTGTPIQNTINELWSLFDFLMPGFLGSESCFNRRFGKALAQAKVSKRGSAEAQAGLLAVDGLHKQVLCQSLKTLFLEPGGKLWIKLAAAEGSHGQVAPFILRRTKDAVLKDLPPKILQDIFCTLSPLQYALYNEFASLRISEEVAQLTGAGRGSSAEAMTEGAPHVFQALQYLRKLCSHPLLVLDPTVDAHLRAVGQVLGQAPADVKAHWASSLAALRAVEHAPKMAALVELLQQCGIVPAGSDDASASDGADTRSNANEGDLAGGHRVLIFAQLKGLLDLVETDVMQQHGISYLRLDGSVEPGKRFGIVEQFNSDPTIQALLLTTHVGGLGLNLTSADTVIFLEHDWNPMRDLQAMDRAHRLGQKRTVTVYRLLMRDTLEDKIMGLQRFKIDVANAAINQDNVSLSAMDTSKLLDLFAVSKDPSAREPGGNPDGDRLASEAETDPISKASGGLKAMMKGLGELANESLYAEEFSLGKFMQKLARK